LGKPINDGSGVGIRKMEDSTAETIAKNKLERLANDAISHTLYIDKDSLYKPTDDMVVKLKEDPLFLLKKAEVTQKEIVVRNINIY